MARQHGATDRESFLELVYRVATTPNGVFGATFMWGYVRWAVENFQKMPHLSQASVEEVFRSAFPGLRVIHAIRHDRLRQAVSWLRAAEDGVWVVSADEPAQPRREPVFQYEVIAGMIDLIAQGEAAWLDLYMKLGLKPLTVVYEELTNPTCYEPTIRRVLEHLDVDYTIEIPRPRTMKQADHVNDEWVDRFIAERNIRDTAG